MEFCSFHLRNSYNFSVKREIWALGWPECSMLMFYMTKHFISSCHQSFSSTLFQAESIEWDSNIFTQYLLSYYLRSLRNKSITVKYIQNKAHRVNSIIKRSLQKCRAPTNIGMIQYLHYSYFSKQLLGIKKTFLEHITQGKRFYKMKRNSVSHRN